MCHEGIDVDSLREIILLISDPVLKLDVEVLEDELYRLHLPRFHVLEGLVQDHELKTYDLLRFVLEHRYG